ncbi:MAG: DUF885 family protein [Pseudomonadales bacterium]|nr:DUF885 family protein [Pseudomonadales bacterium]
MNTKSTLLLFLPFFLSACSFNNILVDTGGENTIYEAPQSSPKPDSISLRRQFENDIAKKLLASVQKVPKHIIPSHQELIEQHLKLKAVLKHLSRLDESLLRPTLRHAIHEKQMVEISLSQAITNWGHRNHLQDLHKLLPPLSFAQHSNTKILKIKQDIINSNQGLQRIRSNLSLGSTFQFSKPIISEAKKRCLKLTSLENNPILTRYQQILLYSDMSQSKQKLDYQSLELAFRHDVVPAYEAFCRFLVELESSKLIAATPTDKLKNEADLDYQSELKQLNTALAPIHSAINEILIPLPQSNLWQIYDAHQQTPKDKQALLDQLTQFVADLHYGLKLWFNDPLEREVLIAADDEIGTVPFYYQSNTAFFDLSLLAKLPSFELETLSYQFALPGMHMLNYASSYENNPLWQEFAHAWSLYVLNLPEAPVYYSHSLSRIAALSRKKLAIHKAIVDINLQLGRWSPETAQTYLMKETPYPIEFIQKQLAMILATPGQARNIWFISEEIKSLWQLDHGLSIKEFHDRILAFAPANLEFLKNQMPAILQQK